jgi:hypothetical protein
VVVGVPLQSRPTTLFLGARHPRSATKFPRASTTPSASFRPIHPNCGAPCPERTSSRIQPLSPRCMSRAEFLRSTGASNIVLLTRLGGGAFGNDDAWIDAAMRRALAHESQRFRSRCSVGELWTTAPLDARCSECILPSLSRLTGGDRVSPRERYSVDIVLIFIERGPPPSSYL